MQETRVQSLGQEIPWRRQWQPTPVFLPGKFHGQRSLVGYSLCGCKELDMTKWLTLSLSPIYISFADTASDSPQEYHFVMLSHINSCHFYISFGLQIATSRIHVECRIIIWHRNVIPRNLPQRIESMHWNKFWYSKWKFEAVLFITAKVWKKTQMSINGWMD